MKLTDKVLDDCLGEVDAYRLSINNGSPSDRRLAEELLACYAADMLPELVEEARTLRGMPLAEQMPRNGQLVALWDATGDYLPTVAALQPNGKWKMERTVWPLDAFTHWLPLPATAALTMPDQRQDHRPCGNCGGCSAGDTCSR